MHPRDPETKEPFDWFGADIKYLPLLEGQIKKTEWVTPPAKAIGLGPVLYLHTMKAFAYLFGFFALINLPIILLYVNGQGPAGLARVQSGAFTDIFGRLAFGNLGVSDFACSNFNIARGETAFRWTCPSGRLHQLFAFGMQKIDNQSCTTDTGLYLGESGTQDDLQIDCNFEQGLTLEGSEALLSAF